MQLLDFLRISALIAIKEHKKNEKIIVIIIKATYFKIISIISQTNKNKTE